MSGLGAPRRVRRWLLAAVFLCATVATAAPVSEADMEVLRSAKAGRSEAAEKLAVRFGQEADIDGLRAIASLKSAYLMYRAADGARGRRESVVPAAVEQLILDNYDDKDLQRPMLAMFASDIDEKGRSPRYRSRKLFDRLLADTLRGGSESYHYAIRLVATDLPGVEPQLTDALRTLNGAEANELVAVLGRRRYAPAAPVLRALQERTPFARDTNGLLANIDHALIQIGTPEAAQAVVDRVRWLSSQQAVQASLETVAILNWMAQSPADALPDFAAVRRAMPQAPDERQQAALTRLVAARKDKRGVPDLVRAVGEGNEPALDPLLALGTPSDWREARAQLARLPADSRIAPARRAALDQKLAAAVDDPAGASREQHKRERSAAFDQQRSRLQTEKNRLQALRESDPAGFMRGRSAWVEQWLALARDAPDPATTTSMRDNAANEYVQLASYSRFVLRQPREAIALYQKAAALRGPASWFPNDELAIADIQRFDLALPREAVAQYRAVLARLDGGTASGAGAERKEAVRAMHLWLGHEIAYLEQGRVYSGAIKRSDLAFQQMILVLAAMGPLTEGPGSGPSPVTSQFNLTAILNQAASVPAAQTKALLARNDPAGYLSATMLAMAVWMAEQRANAAALPELGNLRAVRDLLFKERGIRAELDPDPRFASPDATWKFFLASARRGDAQAMLSCFTGAQRGQLEPLFTRMNRDELARMADGFSAFQPGGGFGNYREATIVRKGTDGASRASLATFVDEGGEWKIESM